MYRYHTRCRACGLGAVNTPSGIKAETPDLKLNSVMNLGVQPLANDFRTAQEDHAGFAPLEVLMCPRCTLAQLSVVVDPDIMYRNYPYVTASTKSMFQHFREFSDFVESESVMKIFGRVLEIGSNDGAFLNSLTERSGVHELIGVDPASNLAALAGTHGIDTIWEMWGMSVARFLAARGPFDTVIARHVLAHIDNWKEFFESLACVTHTRSIVAIEVPYVLSMIEKLSFDQVYHEHLSYVSVTAILWALKSTAFYLAAVREFPVHGGVMVFILKRRENEVSVEFNTEREAFLFDAWKELSLKKDTLIEQLKAIVVSATEMGKDVCGLGASAKSTVWVNCCSFNRHLIRFICDSTPAKQYRFSPGTDIPITDEGALMRELPAYAILFAWNFEQDAIAKHSRYLEKGGTFVIPLPKLRYFPNRP